MGTTSAQIESKSPVALITKYHGTRLAPNSIQKIVNHIYLSPEGNSSFFQGQRISHQDGTDQIGKPSQDHTQNGYAECLKSLLTILKNIPFC